MPFKPGHKSQPGLPRSKRRYKVVGLPVGPEYDRSASPDYKEHFRGSLEACLAQYNLMREQGESGSEALVVINGMGQPVYACS